MSSSTTRKLNRRQFLKTAMAVAGAGTLGPARVLGEDRHEPMRWAFLSDTHISVNPDNHYRGFYPYQNLQNITGQLDADLPDGLVVTGDLARLRGHAGDYHNLSKLLNPLARQRPIHMVTGNHDNRDNFLDTFAHSSGRQWRVGGKRMLTVKSRQTMLILLDSLLFVDMPWGRLGRGQRKWLETYLHATDDIPTILFLHHPVKGAGALLDGENLLELVRPISKVKAIVHGHSHEFAFRQADDIHVISLPATGYNQRSAEPVGWIDAHLTGDQGLFTLHAVEGNMRQNGHTERLRWRT